LISNFRLKIDRKKGTVAHTLYNLFLSKKEKNYQIDELTDIEILLKGIERRTGDYRRYFIRLTFKNNEQCVFGECLTMRKISEKV
jgi:hypothetical protein